MVVTIRNSWDKVSTSYWLVPGTVLVLVLVVAQALLSLDAQVDVATRASLDWLRIDDPSAAETILTTVAASMITVAGAVFSITIVALTIAANQFGQRLLRNFMRDRGGQFTLGIFLGTFVYALIVMRRVSTLGEFHEVPSISVYGAIAMALLSVLVLIYFIHHVASSIQVENVVADVANDFNRKLDDLFPENGTDDPRKYDIVHAAALRTLESEAFASVVAARCGYVQAIDYDNLAAWAGDHDAFVEISIHPGTFVLERSPIAKVFGVSALEDAETEEVRNRFHIGDHVTHEQDIAYAIRQFVQIAVRALSPGINDPFTAYLCINRIGAALGRLLHTSFPPAVRYDEQGQLRLVYPMASFANLASVALDEIIEYAKTSSVVILYLLRMMGILAVQCKREQDRLVLWHHAKRCADRGLAHVEVDAVAEEIQSVLQAVRRQLFVAEQSAEGEATRC